MFLIGGIYFFPEKACIETIEKNEPVFEEHDEHRLMINVSRGPLGIYAPVFDGKLEPTNFDKAWNNKNETQKMKC